MITADASHFSIIGPGKARNQDAIISGLKVADGVLFAVADGLGGRPAGDVASKAALVALGLGVATAGLAKTGGPNFAEAFGAACTSLATRTQTVPAHNGMATTISAVFVKDGRAHVGHAGDSRIYRVRDGVMEQVTVDQTVAQRLVDRGELTAAEARRDDRQHMLTSVVSAQPHFDLFETSFDVAAGDRLLLVSDGVYNVIDNDGIEAMSIGAAKASDLTEALYRAIGAIGAVDDATAVCVDIAEL